MLFSPWRDAAYIAPAFLGNHVAETRSRFCLNLSQLCRLVLWRNMSDRCNKDTVITTTVAEWLGRRTP